jgi:hypothetical protein
MWGSKGIVPHINNLSIVGYGDPLKILYSEGKKKLQFCS